MQLAIVNNETVEAFHGGIGVCPICGSKTIAKCGPRILHHWAHHRTRDCDPWWENETLWHREWKNKFPRECREVSHIADDGEIHRADVKTPTGIYIEIQHSIMTDAERISREKFYKNLVWIVDGRGFRKNFDIYHALPDPASEIAQDLVWAKAQRHYRGANAGMYFKYSEARQENPDITKDLVRSGRIYGMFEIEDEVNNAYRGHHQYDWVRPRAAWIEAICPVYIDLGDEYLARLDVYDSSKLQCIKLVSKRNFIHDVMVEENVANIATRFYKVNIE